MTYDLESLEAKFSKLRVDSSTERYTTGKAPHKAVLLISLMLLDSDGRVDLGSFDPDLYLRDTWDEIWSRMDYPSPGNISQPLYHMRSEGFWSFDRDYTGRAPSLTRFNELCGSIHIEADVADLMSNHRRELIGALLNGGYFSEKEAGRLAALIPELEDSFRFERRMEVALKSEFSLDPVTGVIRSPAFRRMVLSAYDETCAICGMRLVSASGVSVIDAAHILPFARFGIDDCRNGMALCKLHHWMFDHGSISVDKRYRVSLSRDIVEAPDLLKEFDGSEIVLPEDDEKYPAETALEWHRKNVFIL